MSPFTRFLFDSAGFILLLGTLMFWGIQFSRAFGRLEGIVEKIAANDIPHVYAELKELREDLLQVVSSSKT